MSIVKNNKVEKMKLIVISSSALLENEAQIVTLLFEAGLETYHLRKLKLSTKKMKDFICEIPACFHNRIFIHSHHKLAYKYKLGGIHLTATHKKRQNLTWLLHQYIKFKNSNIKISTSFKTIGQLLEGNINDKYSYVFLSPVFDSHHSKFQGGFTDHSLRSALSKTNFKVIARGGVDVTSIEKANELGFDGLAFYSSIWKKSNPLEEFNKIVEKFQELNIPID